MTRGQEFRRGWTVLVAAGLAAGTGVAPLAYYSVGALVEPLSAAFGWTRAGVTAAPLFFSLGTLAAGAALGSVADRYGARPVGIVSQVLLAAAFCGLAWIGPEVWTLYLGYFLLAIVAGGTLPMTWSRAITGWFVTARGFALGLSLMGTGIIGAILPSYVGWLSGRFGWQGAYIGIALLPLCLSLPFTLLWFREPEERITSSGGDIAPESRRGLRLPEALRTLAFWQVAIAFCLAATAVSAVIVHALPLLTDRHVDRTDAARVAGLVGLSVTFGRLVSGFLLDTVRPQIVAACMLGAPALSCFLLNIAAANLVLSSIAVILVGLAAGAEHDIAAYFVARHFGRKHFGAIYGLLFTIYNVGAGLGPMLVGAVYDRNHDYGPALSAGVLVFLVAAALAGTLRTPPLGTGAPR